MRLRSASDTQEPHREKHGEGNEIEKKQIVKIGREANFKKRCMMASNPIGSISTTDKLKQVLQTVTDAALFIEQILAAATGDGFGAQGVEQLTAAFGNLAAVAIQAAHDAMGIAITPDSVLALMPVSTPLAQAQAN